MRSKCLGLVVLVAALTAGGALQGGGAVEGDLKNLQGAWKFVAQEMDGKAMPKEEVAKLTITFVGDKWTVRLGDKVVQGGTHKLDASKTPAQVDAVVTEGENKGATMLGIYELKSDSLRVCFDMAGKERPTGFVTKAGQFSASIVRLKKK